MDDLLGLAVMLSVPGYGLLQWHAARNWHGGWRIAALTPLAIMAPLVIHAAIAFMAQSNLWPLMVILASPLACLYLIALAGARALAR
jgi:hypothetical protein